MTNQKFLILKRDVMYAKLKSIYLRKSVLSRQSINPSSRDCTHKVVVMQSGFLSTPQQSHVGSGGELDVQEGQDE